MKMTDTPIRYVLVRGQAPVFELPEGFGPPTDEAGRVWLEAVAKYFAEEGRKGGKRGGKSKSKAKVAAARTNGRLGGRPRGNRNNNNNNEEGEGMTIGVGSH